MGSAPPDTKDAPYTFITVSPESLRTVQKIAQEHHTTVMVVILSAYAEAAAETLGRKGLLASIVTSARDQPALTSMVSCITTPLPISIPHAGSGQLSKVLSEASGNLTAAMQHSIPYRLLQDAAGDKAEALPFLTLNADLDLTSADFDFQGAQPYRLDGMKIAGLYARAALIAYRRILMFFRADADGGLTGGLAWNAAFLDKEQGQRIAKRFQVWSFMLLKLASFGHVKIGSKPWSKLNTYSLFDRGCIPAAMCVCAPNCIQRLS